MIKIDSDLELERNIYLEGLSQELDDIEHIILLILKVENDNKLDELLSELLRNIHSIKGNSGSYGLNLVSTICHIFEDYLASCRKIFNEESIEKLLNFIDLIIESIHAYKKKDQVALDQIKKRLGINDKNTIEEEELIIVDSSSRPVFSKVKRVLVAETSNLLVRTISKILTEFDVEVISVNNGYAALGLLLESKFDLFISSLNLSTINASELNSILALTTNTNKSIQTIIITSSENAKADLSSKDMLFVEKNSNFELSLKSLIVKMNIFSKKTDSLSKIDSLKILVIDDSPEIHLLIKKALKKNASIKLIVCNNPLEAESFIINEAPNLIFLDVQMPEISGDILFAQLKAKNLLKNVLTVFLTATSESSELDKLLKLSPRGILKKPFSTKNLLPNIEKILKD